jgi:hypothetical protein
MVAPLPQPGSADLEAFLLFYEGGGLLPLVGVGNAGPRLPQIRPPDSDAPTRADLNRDLARVETERYAWAQPAVVQLGPITDANRDEVLRREARFQPAAKWHPGRRPTVCMAAAAASRLDGMSDGEIATGVLGLEGTLTSHDLDRRRFKTVARTIVRGDSLWRSLGAWPWAAFEDALPATWWQHEAAARSLRELCARLADEARREADQLAAKADRLERWISLAN